MARVIEWVCGYRGVQSHGQVLNKGHKRASSWLGQNFDFEKGLGCSKDTAGGEQRPKKRG